MKKIKHQSKISLVDLSVKILLDRQPKVLMYDIPSPDCSEEEKNRLCFITLQEHIIPNTSIQFEVCGYTYNHLENMHLSNNLNPYVIQGQLYYTTYMGEGRFGETRELRKYFIEIEKNNCCTKDRRLIGAKLVDLILQNYETFCISEISHNFIDNVTENLTEETIDFYEDLGFRIDCESDNKTKFTKSFEETPAPRYTKILDTPKEWL